MTAKKKQKTLPVAEIWLNFLGRRTEYENGLFIKIERNTAHFPLFTDEAYKYYAYAANKWSSIPYKTAVFAPIILECDDRY